jgi:hypothetical protein
MAGDHNPGSPSRTGGTSASSANCHIRSPGSTFGRDASAAAGASGLPGDIGMSNVVTAIRREITKAGAW